MSKHCRGFGSKGGNRWPGQKLYGRYEEYADLVQTPKMNGDVGGLAAPASPLNL